MFSSCLEVILVELRTKCDAFKNQIRSISLQLFYRLKLFTYFLINTQSSIEGFLHSQPRFKISSTNCKISSKKNGKGIREQARQLPHQRKHQFSKSKWSYFFYSSQVNLGLNSGRLQWHLINASASYSPDVFVCLYVKFFQFHAIFVCCGPGIMQKGLTLR